MVATFIGLIRRAVWGARGRLTSRIPRQHRVIVHTEAGAPMPADATPAQERARMRAIDAFHVSLGWAGFGYSEAAFPSGRVYEGRGVRRQGAHTVGHNDQFAFMLPGHGDRTPMTELQIAAIRQRIRTHIAAGDLTAAYQVSGHRDHIPPGTKSCPGNKVYPQLHRLRDALRPDPVVDNQKEYEEMKRGDTGGDVRKMQERLKQLGHYTGILDGDFGPKTEKAVSDYQERRGLEVTGRVSLWTAVDLQGFAHAKGSHA